MTEPGGSQSEPVSQATASALVETSVLLQLGLGALFVLGDSPFLGISPLDLGAIFLGHSFFQSPFPLQ